jgi:hypothetical protein
MMTDAIERARRACLSLPEATEQEAWGEPTWRVKKKVFAMFASAKNHHGAGHDSLWCAAPVGVMEIMVRSDPEKFFRPPYVGTKGWVGIRLDAVDDAELRSLVVQSYCEVAPKKLQALVAD